MIVSGGKILGIHKVEHDLTFSGDGVRTPLGLDHGLLEEIHNTSAKLEKSEFDSWSAQTEHWDIDEYTGGDGIKVYDHEISVSGKYLTSEDLNPYATSSWVEENFLNKADYREYSDGNDLSIQEKEIARNNIGACSKDDLDTSISRLEKSIAPTYNQSATYPIIGTLCMHDDVLYRNKVAISTAEDWTEDHWEVVDIAGLLKTTCRVFGATFTPSSGTYQWPDAAEVASAVSSGKCVEIDLSTQGNVVRYYLHYTNGSSVYIFESASFSRITLTNGEYAVQSTIDTELNSNSTNPVTNSALTDIIGNIEDALAGL